MSAAFPEHDERFQILEPSEHDILEDDLSARLYRIIDTQAVAPSNEESSYKRKLQTVAYTKTNLDAAFTASLMNRNQKESNG